MELHVSEVRTVKSQEFAFTKFKILKKNKGDLEALDYLESSDLTSLSSAELFATLLELEGIEHRGLALSVAKCALLRLGDYTRAQRSRILQILGVQCVHGGYFEEAREYFRQAQSEGANRDVLAVNLGVLCIQQEQYQKARDHFVEAIEENKNCSNAWLGLAMLSFRCGDKDLGFAHLLRALDANPTNTVALDLLVSWSVENGVYSSAISALQKYMVMDSLNDRYSKILTLLLFKAGRRDELSVEWVRASILNPKDQELMSLDL